MNRRNFIREMGVAGAVLAFSGYTAIANDRIGKLPNIVYI